MAQFGFGADKAETTAEDLSGGERARLLLQLVAMQKPHLLILDEPTNHLDIDSRRALTDALNDYEGAVLLITHDRSLIELVTDRLWLAADGTVQPFEGDVDAYAALVLERARAAARAEGAGTERSEASSQKTQRKAAAEARARVAPLKRAVEQVEQQMERLSRSLAELDAQLADPALFTRDPGLAVKLGKERAAAADALAAAETEWMDRAEAYEAARAGAGV